MVVNWGLSLLLLNLRPGILQTHRAIEHELTVFRIEINAEIALPQELILAADRRIGQRRFDLAAGQHFQRTRIQVRLVVFALLRPCLGSSAMNNRSNKRTSASTACCADTQCKCPLNLAIVRSATTARFGIVGAMQLDHFAGLVVFDHLLASDIVGVFQSHFSSGSQSEELLVWFLAEIILLDIDDFREGYLARPGIGILRIVDRLEFLDLPSG